MYPWGYPYCSLGKGLNSQRVNSMTLWIELLISEKKSLYLYVAIEWKCLVMLECPITSLYAECARDLIAQHLSCTTKHTIIEFEDGYAKSRVNTYIKAQIYRFVITQWKKMTLFATEIRN